MGATRNYIPLRSRMDFNAIQILLAKTWLVEYFYLFSEHFVKGRGLSRHRAVNKLPGVTYLALVNPVPVKN
jgi:hypothetical protein